MSEQYILYQGSYIYLLIQYIRYTSTVLCAPYVLHESLLHVSLSVFRQNSLSCLLPDRTTLNNTFCLLE